LFISFAPPKEMNQRKRVRKRQPHPVFRQSLKAISRSKKQDAVRTFSGFPLAPVSTEFQNQNKDILHPGKINIILVMVGGQTENGAKLSLYGSANKACVAGVRTGLTYRFRRPFFGSFFGRTKKEQIN